MELEQEIQYGHSAAEILENPVWGDVWSQYEKQIQEALLATPVRDADALRLGVQALQVMRNVRMRIEQTLQTGKMAEIQLREKTRLQEVREWARDTLNI